MQCILCARQPPPTTPASVGYELRSYRFACQNGKVKEHSEEFEAFKKHYYHSSWGRYVSYCYHSSQAGTYLTNNTRHGVVGSYVSLHFPPLNNFPQEFAFYILKINQEVIAAFIYIQQRRHIENMIQDCEAKFVFLELDAIQ